MPGTEIFQSEQVALRAFEPEDIPGLFTHSGNPRAVRLAEKSGFKESMRQREAIFKEGQLYDNLMMDLLREEYYERHGEIKDHFPSLR